MRRRPGRAVLLGCLLLSGLVNLGGLHGVVGLIRRGEPPPPREREQWVAFELRPDPEALPPPDPEATPLPPRPEKIKKKKPELELDPLDEEEEEEEEKKPEPTPEPEPEPEQEKPKADFVFEQLKMVEQPDETDEDKAPDAANYLSNVNRDVTEETRAAVTNLAEDATKIETHQVEPASEPTPGNAAEQQIAQVQEQPSQLAREAPPEPVSPEDRRPSQDDPQPKSLLSMRELAPRDHHQATEAKELLAEQAEDGTLAPERPKDSSLAPNELRARNQRNDPSYRFRMSSKELQALFGKDLAAIKREVSEKRSKTPGLWAEAQKRWISPLENMVPEVKVGNQTALRSRRHPFARYIATMHRAIHDLWAWGFLGQLDRSGRNNPLNDPDLWTRVEIVLNGDGTIDKVINVRHSGKGAFDGAAREIVWAAGPFPNPPPEIVSPNGKIYIHWAFHRDERACGTFGAQPFILDSQGGGDRPDPDTPIRAGRSEEQLGRRLPPAGGTGGKGSAGHAHPHAHGPEGPVPRSGAGPAAPSSVPPQTHAGAPNAGQPSGAPAEASADDPAARKTASAWLSALSEGKIDRMVGRSGLPFHAGDRVVARTREELKALLESMADEARESGGIKGVKLYGAAELRKELGSVPAGVQEGERRVYALTRVGDDTVILLLERNFGAWRVVGVTR